MKAILTSLAAALLLMTILGCGPDNDETVIIPMQSSPDYEVVVESEEGTGASPDYNAVRSRNGQIIAFEPYPKSPFYKKISSSAQVDDNSDAMINRLTSCHAFSISVREWTIPVFFADTGTQRYNVSITSDTIADPPYYLLNVPIPSDAKPDPEDDGHLTVVSFQDGYVYEFWRAENTGKGWKADWGNRIALSGDGIYDGGFASRASGISGINGMVWPGELSTGKINHALAASICTPKKDVVVWPATETDGVSGRTDAIPEGARLRLDPSYDISSLPAHEQVIAKALQEYGMFVTDYSGDVEIEVVHPYSFQSDPYGWASEPYYIMNIPISAFQVMLLPEQKKANTDLKVMEPGIYSKVEWNYLGWDGN